MNNIAPYRENFSLEILKSEHNFVDEPYKFPESVCRGCGNKDSSKYRYICGHSILSYGRIEHSVIPGCNFSKKDEHYHITCESCKFHWITRTKKQEEYLRKNQYSSVLRQYISNHYPGFIVGTMSSIVVYYITLLFG